ncbi:hypothetical protein AUK14_03170 [Candidatus Berkelbacteria bacterium CG2_30_39_44]|nr:MAG: hypothetical protein AUK14_03170 [Candidatus Berkelbacteria bacterium CG2_30_39_44]PIX30498.1 MAG: hypothetical protein COZ62_02340 [Candidatus Berkelbacteria bacterium CG_4_8_14_3_um_filter_39_27]
MDHTRNECKNESQRYSVYANFSDNTSAINGCLINKILVNFVYFFDMMIDAVKYKFANSTDKATETGHH